MFWAVARTEEGPSSNGGLPQIRQQPKLYGRAISNIHFWLNYLDKDGADVHLGV